MLHSNSRISADRHANGMSRATLESVDDTKLMQEIGVSLFADEAMTGVERFVQYGMTSVPLPPTTSSGGLRKAAEVIFSFLGGNRSHGIAMMVGDRRFRLKNLAGGEVALHDDQGHQHHIARDGIYTSAPNSKKIVHQVMTSDAAPNSDGSDGQTAQKGQPVVANNSQNNAETNTTHTQQITHGVAPSIGTAISEVAGAAGQVGGIVGQLSGLASQVSALAGAGVGLPGINIIGGQISGLVAQVNSLTTLTGDAASIAGQITSIGNSMASGSTLASAMPALASQMQSLVGQFQGLLTPAGLTQMLHKQIFNLQSGVMKSAFNGLHSIALAAGGIAHISSGNIALTAPSIPHFGNILGSDGLTITKAITAGSVGTTSDARLKSNIRPYEVTLDLAMQLEIKRFDKSWVSYDADGVASIHTDGPLPSFGFIAQDLRKIVPELVSGDEATGFLRVDEGKVGIIALAALQAFVIEQRAEIAGLKQQIEALSAPK